MKIKYLIVGLVLLIITIGVVSAADNTTSPLTVESNNNVNVDSDILNNNKIESTSENYISTNDDPILTENNESDNAQITSVKKVNTYKYIKVGKYKIKVQTDDSLNVQKQKVLKYLKKHVKKGHTYKFHGYKFKVSAKNYIKILYYKKYNYDGKAGDFTVDEFKTNKYTTFKVPIYKTKKITKKAWKYKKVLSYESFYGDDYYDSYSYDLTKYYNKGWKLYGWYDKSYSNGYESYAKLKKKVKTTVTKKKIVGYKKVKVRVYASLVISRNKVGVDFRGIGHGYDRTLCLGYYMF